MLLPTFVGTLLICVWISLRARSPAPLWRLWLLFPGTILLVGNLGIIFEVVIPSNQLDHMHALAQMLAGGGALALLIEISPAVWSCLLIGCTVRRAWQRLLAEQATHVT
jgi:hypothetical protein